MWICISHCREHTSKSLGCGMCSQGILQFYLHTLYLYANGISHTCLFLTSRSWSSFTDPETMEGWVCLVSGYMPKNVKHRELNRDMVACVTVTMTMGGIVKADNHWHGDRRPQVAMHCTLSLFLVFTTLHWMQGSLMRRKLSVRLSVRQMCGLWQKG